ncbi:hypothetical protein CEUSTIGMA_g9184.t1 [Chlamydomonas eustigma]|uniref:Uncharacterized protein n=1 Tax=Chlamydomonas eustigma TaxID=1157962 RepID=A0A250XFE1_9CHLO|nr:hypothetical protein CEUSTIGMA_g9184.t1 [Chlamydomonas eustigma]|eukprot:GAX81756.1 hypothetical protein CEUSTIGMA_g9184.t1 [Chlamydomonas eustigma]
MMEIKAAMERGQKRAPADSKSKPRSKVKVGKPESDSHASSPKSEHQQEQTTTSDREAPVNPPSSTAPVEKHEPQRRFGSAPDTKGLEEILKDGVKVKTLKQSKKDYLNRKKLKKKGRGLRQEASALEQSLRQQGKVNFGETSDKPLEVHLKRKHWTNQERTASDRCKEIFLKQIEGARRKDEALRAGVPVSVNTVSSRCKKWSAHDALSQAEKERLRTDVIEAYRAQKKGVDGNSHGATMSSLSALVHKY